VSRCVVVAFWRKGDKDIWCRAGPVGRRVGLCPGLNTQVPTRLVGADDLEVLVDEDVVGPVDADVVDLVLSVA
jgi:hypothetical protein